MQLPARVCCFKFYSCTVHCLWRSRISFISLRHGFGGTFGWTLIAVFINDKNLSKCCCVCVKGSVRLLSEMSLPVDHVVSKHTRTHM